MRRSWCLIFFFVLALIGLRAAPASVNTLPFKYSEGLLWVQIEVPHSARPLNFLFDTGAEVSVINADTAAILGLPTGGKIKVQGVNTTTTGHWPVRLTATAGKLALPAEYLSLDLSQLALSCGRPLDGLLGADFIQDRVVEIDFQAHLIRFCDQISPAKSDIELPLKLSGRCYCLPVQVNHQARQWVRLDTGCATALQWVTPDANIQAGTAVPAIGLAGSAIPQTQTTVLLGERQFEQVPTGLHRHAMFTGESGLLGNGLLNCFKTVTIDTKTKRLVLSPM